MNIDFSVIAPAIPFIIEGALVTLQFALLSIFFGLIWGSVLVLMRISSFLPFRLFAQAYVSIFRGVPLILQLYMIYFASPQLTGYNLSPFFAGLISFSLNSGAYVSEILRGGINDVDKGQYEAAISLGVPYYYRMKDIILPQALRKVLPSLVNEVIDLIKESSLMSVIGQMDLFRRATIVSLHKFVYFEPFLIAAACYYILISSFSFLAGILERRLNRRD